MTLRNQRRQNGSAHTRSLFTLLTRMNLLVSGAVLLMAAIAFFSYDIFSFRNSLLHNLDAEAQIVGQNSVSALTFDDRQSAADTLKSLEHSPDVLGAAITTNSGETFALYGTPRDGDLEHHSLPAHEAHHTWSSGTYVLVAHRIVFAGKDVGVVYICAQLREIGQRAREYVLIALLILILCMVAAIGISAISRRLIAQPIVSLAGTALIVSRDQDYSVRADIQADSSEILVLINAFNTMLSQIQERDAALNEARAQLEVRVAERTVELQTANQELEAFSYTVAHDLRGPLDAISGITFLLSQADMGTDNPAVLTMLGQLTTSTTNMGTLIDDLLNFSRATTTPIKSTSVDLTAIANEIAAELTTSAPTRNVQFQIHETPTALADPGLMHIVLDNLLRNAWKYSSHHPKACIEFTAREMLVHAERKLVYFVRDDGAGFDPTYVDKLFQPFQRLHGKSEFPGTGIGLATIKRILARQGGTIWAEGAVEKGATFYFTLS